MQEGMIGEYLGWIDHIGARVAMMPADEHDRLCAWISHVPQMISTALAAALVEEFGEDAPLLPGGRPRAAGDDADFGQSVFDVARCGYQQ